MSRVTGLVREIVMARVFGAGLVYDAFLLGFRIPNLTRDLFAEGALSSAFVPIFTEYLATRGRKEAAALSNLVSTAIIILVGTICGLGMVFAPALVDLLAPGFHHIPGKFELAVRMTRIMFPFLLLVALAAQAMGMLNACGVFGVPALASTMFNIGSVSAGLLFGFWAGPHIGLAPIEGMGYGVVLGGALQLAWQLPSLYRLGFRFRPAFDWADTGLRRIIALMGPAILGNAAVQINLVVNTNLAASLEDPVRGADGPVSWLGYAFRFMQLPLGLFGVAMATATLPSISRSAAEGNFNEFRQTLSRSLATVFLLTVPSSVGLVVLGQSIIGAIYQGGRFDLYDTRQTADALSYFAIGLLGYAGVKLMTPAFYALNDALTPMLISLASVLINYEVATTLTGRFGFGQSGLALSTAAVALASFVAQFTILRMKLAGIYGRALMASLWKVTVAAVAMGVLVSGINALVLGRFGMTRAAFLGVLALAIPSGILVFYAVARRLAIPELEPAMRALAAPLAGRLRRGRDTIQ
ncbi:MAG: murein biosynthesis integral membrane protein MurJ [Bryobacterales bacterium]|nr:murein biosynthesis integral membrane protein MurJ [Bryobacterales bacterium]